MQAPTGYRADGRPRPRRAGVETSCGESTRQTGNEHLFADSTRRFVPQVLAGADIVHFDG